MRTAHRAHAARKLWPSIAAVLGLLAADTTHAAMIDFESLPGGSPIDALPIDVQYLAASGMRFALDLDGDGLPDAGALPRLAERGANETWAFVNDVTNQTDEPLPGYESALGDWLLAMTPIHSAGAALLVFYDAPVRAASGQIWDIDGNPLQGTEQWRIDALGWDAAVIASLLSPLGDDLDADGLNAKPWDFAFERDQADIWSLRIEFTGSKTWGLGAGFDRFATVVPEPGTLVLLAGGLALLGARRR